MNNLEALPGFKTLAGLESLKMGQKKNTELLSTDRFYHVFNRGINGGKIFSNEKNYLYFLTLLQKYLIPISNIYSFCLLPNHFHFLIQIKSEIDLKSSFNAKENFDCESFISKQFSNFFNAYSQAYNKSTGRTGRLFEQPFRRIHIDSEDYLRKTILYIHLNPRKHSIEEDIYLYPFSSFQKILSNQDSFLSKSEVINWFDDIENFIYCHENHNLNS